MQHFVRWAEANRLRLERLHETPDDHPLVWRRKLLGEAACQVVGGLMSGLFSRWVWPLLVLLAAAATIAFALTPGSESEASLWTTVPVVLVGILIHELGHITACVRQGARQGGIGIGVYWIWPAFFADVRGSWSLPRLARLQVSAGGLYFQFLYFAVLGCIYLPTRDASICMAMRVTALLMATTCNPVFKYDGYWILSDVANVTNIHGRIGSYIKRLFAGRVEEQAVRLNESWLWISVAFVALAGSYLCYVSMELLGVGANAVRTMVPAFREMSDRPNPIAASEWIELAIPAFQAVFVTFVLSVLATRAIASGRALFRK
ncbi:hypothetical protein [Luteibacter sp.]|uniref:hypothetical protein n=1 Tax=Luteibacter sp. TaxID=1886636 RepID=UPI003F7F2FE4